MPRIPHDSCPESTLAMMVDGYRFISRRCRRYGTDIFEARLMLRKTICMLGEEAARIFYDSERFRRKGAAPRRLQTTLFGKPGIQGMDGDPHRHRKQMFMSLMTPGRIRQLADLTAGQWSVYLKKWEGMRKIVLFDEVREILCRAVCAWAGVPLAEAEVRTRADDFEAMIDGPGAVGPRHWRGKRARRRAEQWIADLVARVRAGDLRSPAGSALDVIACHRDLNGRLLAPREAAVEIINILRPTVAVSRYVIFTAMALHEHTELWPQLQAADPHFDEMFVQEVRRVYPFFPFVAARVRKSFDWRGYHFPRGRRVLLDLYGTNHDPRLWPEPEAFRPERFRNWDENAFTFIPQGGGDHYGNHRCPGEWIAIELTKVALGFLSRSMAYEVPRQNLRLSLSRMPAIPKSGFLIRKVRRR